jgi:hypothetical protein
MRKSIFQKTALSNSQPILEAPQNRVFANAVKPVLDLAG